MRNVTEDYLKERLAAFAQRRAELLHHRDEVLSQINAVEGAMTELSFLLEDEPEEDEPKED